MYCSLITSDTFFYFFFKKYVYSSYKQDFPCLRSKLWGWREEFRGLKHGGECGVWAPMGTFTMKIPHLFSVGGLLLSVTEGVLIYLEYEKYIIGKEAQIWYL